MTFLYTIRATYDKTYNENGGLSWDKYIEWSKLNHLTELISLDGMLNETLVKPNYDDPDDWDYIHVINLYQTNFFTTLDYILKRSDTKGKFHLLKVIVEPELDCKDIPSEDYEFIGYELLDQYFNISALTNCGGFDETFSPSDLNKFGLITDYSKAYHIKKCLLENNPNEEHADTNVIAVWRHKTIGRR
ncbi:hypothetical protein [Pedobacter nototheniae]|uniref:hypothetical protein n=1 Tax=Pedobacter nototheniae TaxID=2488994 RepID=UPI00103B0472|nr:hypothetical protein [Pedobacter nototheniae]